MLYRAAELAAERGHEPVLIATCPAAPEYSVREDDFRRLAKKLDVPFFLSKGTLIPKHVQMLRDCRADVAISVNWLTLLPQEVLDLFPLGVINAHAGDLPRYRGNACPNWAILKGEPEVVVCLHRMEKYLDSGEVYLRHRIPITDETYIGDIYAELDRVVPIMFVQLLDRLTIGAIQGERQPDDPSCSLRCYPRLPTDGLINWDQSACHIARLVRATSEPFSGAFSYLNSHRLTIWRAHAFSLPYPFLGVPGQVADIENDGSVLVLCGEGVLRVELISYLSPAKVKPGTVITSRRVRLGLDLVAEFERLRAAQTMKRCRF
jgi:UDP-4-amino-4-deoxy-L-arabinose formyltransferase/UDP-glucuronic acid dehydrogenase (UDP-4-keto-hexauronic acid decarboxylating)